MEGAGVDDAAVFGINKFIKIYEPCLIISHLKKEGMDCSTRGTAGA